MKAVEAIGRIVVAEDVFRRTKEAFGLAVDRNPLVRASRFSSDRARPAYAAEAAAEYGKARAKALLEDDNVIGAYLEMKAAKKELDDALDAFASATDRPSGASTLGGWSLCSRSNAQRRSS